MLQMEGKSFLFSLLSFNFAHSQIENLKPEIIEIEVKSERIALYISDGKE